MAGWRRRIDDLFGIDLRSLATFRIAIAGVLTYDLIDRSRDLTAHYTELGVLPVASLSLISDRGASLLLSPHYLLSGSVAGEALLFLLGGLAALALLLGYRTRLASVVSWLLLVSLHLRNPYVASLGGDSFLRVLLFWGMFLPLGARWSLDARRRPAAAQGQVSVLSVASAALLIQVFLMYFNTGMVKNGPDWRDGTAVYYALHLDYFATSLGVWLRQYDELTRVFTHLTRWFEILGPFLAFVPVHTGTFRLLAIALFIGFHVSLAACLWIGPFPVMSLAAWMAFIPASFWDWLLPRLRRRPAGPETPPAPAAAASATRVIGTPRALQALVAVLLCWCVATVATHTGFLPRKAFPRWFWSVGPALGIQQYWSMFAPVPSHYDVWPVVVGTLADGVRRDPLRDAPVSWARPASLPDVIPSFRQRLYLLRIFERAMGAGLPSISFDDLGDYLCRNWNARHPEHERLRGFELFLLIEQTDAPPDAAPERHLAHRHRCRQNSAPMQNQARELRKGTVLRN